MRIYSEAESRTKVQELLAAGKAIAGV